MVEKHEEADPLLFLAVVDQETRRGKGLYFPPFNKEGKPRKLTADDAKLVIQGAKSEGLRM